MGEKGRCLDVVGFSAGGFLAGAETLDEGLLLAVAWPSFCLTYCYRDG